MDFLRYLRFSAACECGSSTCFANREIVSFCGDEYGDSHGVCYVLTWWDHIVDAHSRVGGPFLSRSAEILRAYGIELRRRASGLGCGGGVTMREGNCAAMVEYSSCSDCDNDSGGDDSDCDDSGGDDSDCDDSGGDVGCDDVGCDDVGCDDSGGGGNDCDEEGDGGGNSDSGGEGLDGFVCGGCCSGLGGGHGVTLVGSGDVSSCSTRDWGGRCARVEEIGVGFHVFDLSGCVGDLNAEGCGDVSDLSFPGCGFGEGYDCEKDACVEGGKSNCGNANSLGCCEYRDVVGGVHFGSGSGGGCVCSWIGCGCARYDKGTGSSITGVRKGGVCGGVLKNKQRTKKKKERNVIRTNVTKKKGGVVDDGKDWDSLSFFDEADSYVASKYEKHVSRMVTLNRLFMKSVNKVQGFLGGRACGGLQSVSKLYVDPGGRSGSFGLNVGVGVLGCIESCVSGDGRLGSCGLSKYLQGHMCFGCSEKFVSSCCGGAEEVDVLLDDCCDETNTGSELLYGFDDVALSSVLDIVSFDVEGWGLGVQAKHEGAFCYPLPCHDDCYLPKIRECALFGV
eukprot:3940348-Rhodomonas_salina.1